MTDRIRWRREVWKLKGDGWPAARKKTLEVLTNIPPEGKGKAADAKRREASLNRYSRSKADIGRAIGQSPRNVQRHWRWAEAEGYLIEHAHGWGDVPPAWHLTLPGQTIECDDCADRGHPLAVHIPRSLTDRGETL